MKLVVAGGAGFLGRALIGEMTPVASEIVVLSRSPTPTDGARVVLWDGQTVGEWAAELDGADAVVNYAGSPIFALWTRATRERILSSRVDSTKAIASAISECPNPPGIWVNGSATGYYGDRGADMLDETAELGSGFLAGVCRDWEAAASANSSKTAVTLLRTAVVLDPSHPPLSIWLRLNRLFLGGRVGDGAAYLPWIGLKDHARLVRFCIEREISGPVNAVAPEAVTNAELMRALRARLKRPSAPSTPAWALRFAARFGFPVETVLGSTRAVPAVASLNGFKWLLPAISDLVRDIQWSDHRGSLPHQG